MSLNAIHKQVRQNEEARDTKFTGLFGFFDGLDVGLMVGYCVGLRVGKRVGLRVGKRVGFRVGLVVEGGVPSHDGAQRQMSGNSDVTVEQA